MIRKHTHRFVICLIAAVATAAALASGAAAGTAAGAGDPGQAARGQALNQLYGSGATTMTADQFRATISAALPSTGSTTSATSPSRPDQPNRSTPARKRAVSGSTRSSETP